MQQSSADRRTEKRIFQTIDGTSRMETRGIARRETIATPRR